MSRPKTVLDVVQLAAGHLKAAGVSTPRLDAEVLLGHVLGLERIQLYVQHDRPLVPDELEAYRAATARRARREPVAYITGRREFYSLSFAVDRRVLIPRPETERLVEIALDLLRSRFPSEERLLVADVGTGSGAIAVALAHSEPRARVVATDASPEALQVAKFNVEQHGLSNRIELRRGDVYAPLRGERFHAIVSNPPYVKEADYPGLPPEVRDYEPKGALVAGKDGLAVIRRLVAGAAGYLVPGGFLAFEIGWDQAEDVRVIAREAGLFCTRIVPDLAGKDRVAVVEAIAGGGG